MIANLVYFKEFSINPNVVMSIKDITPEITFHYEGQIQRPIMRTQVTTTSGEVFKTATAYGEVITKFMQVYIPNGKGKHRA